MPIFFSKPNIAKLLNAADEKKLIRALEFNDTEVQAEAVAALGKLGGKNAAQAIGKVTNKTNSPNLRLSCIEALGAIGNPLAAPLLHGLAENRLQEMEKPANSWDPKSVPLNAVVEALGRCGDDKTPMVLMDLYAKTKNSSARQKIVATLGKMDNPAVREFLSDLLVKEIDSGLFNRSEILQIMEVMKQFPGDAAIQAIIHGLNHTGHEIIDCAPWDREFSVFSKQMKLFGDMLGSAWEKMSVESLQMIENIPDPEDRFTYPETRVPGDDGWGKRDDEVVAEVVHKGKIDCSTIREKATRELRRRNALSEQQKVGAQS